MEYMICPPGTEFNDAGECIDSEIQSRARWWNEQPDLLTFVIATMIVTTSIAMIAAWSYNAPPIWQFRQNTCYKLFGQHEGMASILESLKIRLND